MTFTTSKTKIKLIKSGDPDFTFSTDGITVTRRAGIEIDPKCPMGYRELLIQAVSRGWIKPFAVMKDNELMWDKLSE